MKKGYRLEHIELEKRFKTPNIELEYFRFALEEAGKAARFFRPPRVSADQALKIQLPSLEAQNKFVRLYQKAQAQIEEMKLIIAAAPTKKQAALDKWL